MAELFGAVVVVAAVAAVEAFAAVFVEASYAATVELESIVPSSALLLGLESRCFPKQIPYSHGLAYFRDQRKHYTSHPLGGTSSSRR
jgi:hypothetical protein